MNYEERVQHVAEAIHGLPDSEAAQCMARAAIAASDATLEVTDEIIDAYERGAGSVREIYGNDQAYQKARSTKTRGLKAALAAMRGDV